MKVLEQSADRVVIRCGSPWYALCGLPFLAYGLGYLIPALIDGSATNYLIAGCVGALFAGLLTSFMCAHHSLVTLDRPRKKVFVERRWYPFSVCEMDYDIKEIANSKLDIDDSSGDGYCDRVALVSKSGELIPLTATRSGAWNSKEVCDVINDFFDQR